MIYFVVLFFFFFNDTATTEIYTLSLHDALPILMVRHRAKLVAWRSALKASVHAVLAKQGLHPQVTDLFGVAGRAWLNTAPLDAAYRLRVNALLRLIDAIEFELTAV